MRARRRAKQRNPNGLVLAVVLAGCGGLEPKATESAPAPRSEVPAVAPAPVETETTAPLVFERQRLEVEADDGHRLTVWAKLPEAPRAAILLVHGRTWSSIPDFDLQVDGERVSLMDDLAAAGWATYAVDLRGYGGTARSSSGWTTPDRAARDTAEVLRFIGSRHPSVGKPALFGWSNGSMVAQLVAQRDPDLLSDLILYGYPTGPTRTFKDPTGEPAKTKTTAEGAASDFITPTVSDAVKDAFVASCLEADPVRSDWNELTQWNALRPEDVSVPTLLIHGEHDPFARPAAHAAMMERLGHGDRRWVVVPRGDHAAHLEQVRGHFLAALFGFLDRGDRGR